MWLDVEQNSDKWFNLRLKISTSSNFDKIMAFYDAKKFKWGEGAIKYAQQVALERVTGVRDTTCRFKNKSMERGSLLEPVAVRLYERETLYNVTNGGIHIAGTLGDSPDGLVGLSGCVEVKVVEPATFWTRIKEGGINRAYKWQIQGHIYVGNKKWCDFVNYCPEFPEGRNLYIYRQERDEDMIYQLEKRLVLFEDLIRDNVKLLLLKERL